VAMDPDLPSRRLGAFLGRHNIRYVSLLPEFRARGRTLPPLYVRQDAHWTVDGHRLATDLLVDGIHRALDESDRRVAVGKPISHGKQASP
jgi:hypothetical protein